eukprot:TRINITY_DN4426_c0_g1_i2.p1 TRINITY_DN4426_c0_g1~~TRINITY_DN4426_c0_g1_i2.p1  ORF type:complete len:685 (-),score=216.74 TRINITY_DN4426_c0_g1_i2:37-2091(-)
MNKDLHFRPRPIDVNVKLPIWHEDEIDVRQLKEVEAEASHFIAVTEKKRGRKNQSDPDVEEPIPIVVDGTSEVPIPSVSLIDEISEPKRKKLKSSHKFSRPKEYISYEHRPLDFERDVEYDYDSEDEDFLEAFNKRVTKKEMLTEDQFESLIDIFEKEAHEARYGLDPECSELFRLTNEDVPCSICQEELHTSNNLIVFCDGCNIAVHQKCYGITDIPSDAWLCRKCEAKATDVRCVFCAQKSGAFKPTTTNKWAHVSCAFWIPGISFQDGDTLEPIVVPKKSKKEKPQLHKCCACKQTIGICVRCSLENCDSYFHVECARTSGFSMEYVEEEDESNHPFSQYCQQHTMENELRKETPFAEWDLDSNQEEKLQSIVTKFEREMLANIPISTIKLVYYFWKRKRRHHPTSLLRRYHAIDVGGRARPHLGGVNAAYNRMIRLRQDFEKVRILVDLVRKRELMKRDQCKAMKEIFDAEMEVKLEKLKNKKPKKVKKAGETKRKQPAKEKDEKKQGRKPKLEKEKTEKSEKASPKTKSVKEAKSPKSATKMPKTAKSPKAAKSPQPSKSSKSTKVTAKSSKITPRRTGKDSKMQDDEENEEVRPAEKSRRKNPRPVIKESKEELLEPESEGEEEEVPEEQVDESESEESEQEIVKRPPARRPPPKRPPLPKRGTTRKNGVAKKRKSVH